MCIEKHLALYAKSEAGYIKHLESLLLDSEDFKRCYMCNRVESVDYMSEALEGDAYVCEGRCENEFNKGKEILESDERDYRQAKGNS
jgi:hypothetical protein